MKSNQQILNEMFFVDKNGEPIKKKYGWISIHEIDYLPESFEEVLFSDGKEIFKGYRLQSMIDDPDTWFAGGDFNIHHVTHWRLLPELPIQKEIK